MEFALISSVQHLGLKEDGKLFRLYFLQADYVRLYLQNFLQNPVLAVFPRERPRLAIVKTISGGVTLGQNVVTKDSNAFWECLEMELKDILPDCKFALSEWLLLTHTRGGGGSPACSLSLKYLTMLLDPLANISAGGFARGRPSM